MERLGMKGKEMETENHPAAAALVVLEGGEAAIVVVTIVIIVIEGRSEEIEIVVVTIAATFVDQRARCLCMGIGSLVTSHVHVS